MFIGNRKWQMFWGKTSAAAAANKHDITKMQTNQQTATAGSTERKNIHIATYTGCEKNK